MSNPTLPANAAAQPRRGLEWGLVVVVLTLYAAATFVTRLPGVSASNDDAIYVFLARALLDGTYRDTFLPGAPLHVQYPPGWPALLAVPIALLGENPALLLILPLVLSLGGLLFFYLAARSVVPPVVALAVLVLSAMNPLVLNYGGRLMAEASFFFFAMMALWSFSASDPTPRRLWLGCFAAIASALCRSAGVAVIGAAVLHLAIGRRWRWAFGLATVAALTFGSWMAWSLFSPRQIIGRSYGGDLLIVHEGSAERFGDRILPARVLAIWNSAKIYLLGHIPAVLGYPKIPGTLVDNVGWLVLAGVGGIAGAVAQWRRARFHVLVLAFLIGILVVWTWDDRRFLHPVVPLALLMLAVGLERLSGRLPLLARGVLLGALGLLLGVGVGNSASALLSAGRKCDRERPLDTCYTSVETAFLRAAEAAKALPPGAVIMAQREAAFAYHSGHPGVYAYEAVSRDPSKFMEFLREGQVSHVLLSRITRNEPVTLGARLESVCEQLDLAGEFGEATYLFRIRSVDEGPDPERRVCPVLSAVVAETREIRAGRIKNPDVFRVAPRPDSSR